MKEVSGDLLTYEHYDPSTPVWKVLPTNYTVDSKGLAIMGAGLVKQFADEYGAIVKYELGAMIQCNPTTARILPLGIHGNAFWWALPTKRKPEDNSDVELLRSGLWELALYYQRQCFKPVVVVPRLGCECGKMKWKYSKATIETELSRVNEVVVCHVTMRG